MRLLLLLLALPAWSQQASSTTADAQRLDAIDTTVSELRSGRPTITGIPTFAGGICLGSSSTCITTPVGTSSTQTFTGANTFAGQVFVTSNNYTTSGAVITVGAPERQGFPSVLVSTQTNSLASLSISGLPANSNYILVISSFVQTTANAGALRIGFNNDSTAGHYSWNWNGAYAAGTGLLNGSTSDSSCHLHYETGTNDTMSIGAGGSYRIYFHTYGGNSTTHFFSPWSKSTWDSVNSRQTQAAVLCGFLQTTTINRVDIKDAAGGFSAVVTLIREG